MRYFFYGTLLDADVRDLVIGDVGYTVEPASLPGFRRLCIRRRTYPVILPAPHVTVEGCLARGLDRAAAARLIAFETDEYIEVGVNCRISGGRDVPCRVFIAGPLARPSSESWELAVWQRRHKRNFLRRYRRDNG